MFVQRTSFSKGKDDYLTVLGKTISTDDFYEGQVFHASDDTDDTDDTEGLIYKLGPRINALH